MAPTRIMVNGIPGNMAVNVATHAQNDDRFEVVPYALTGPEITETHYQLSSDTIELIHPDQCQQRITEIISQWSPFISIDFTHPSAVNANARFYCQNKLPFVMGTTGGDRDQLLETVEKSAIAAVIAPNMGKQIVGFQAMMEYAAQNFPNLFSGYNLTIRESHQCTKADTSGTAKAMVKYFNRLGIPFTEDQIQKERDPETQKNQWGIPEPYLSGHGWHTYELTSSDGTVQFKFCHNVNGRDIYALGTLDAVLFLQKKIDKGITARVFTMIDVLKGE